MPHRRSKEGGGEGEKDEGIEKRVGGGWRGEGSIVAEMGSGSGSRRGGAALGER